MKVEENLKDLETLLLNLNNAKETFCSKQICCEQCRLYSQHSTDTRDYILNAIDDLEEIIETKTYRKDKKL